MVVYADRIVDLLDTDGRNAVIQAGESSTIEGSLKDGEDAIEKTLLTSFKLTLFDEATGSIINSRNDQSVLDENGGLVDSNGNFNIVLGTLDNVIVGSPAVGELEAHIARLTWEWTSLAVQRKGIQQFRFHVEKIKTFS